MQKRGRYTTEYNERVIFRVVDGISFQNQSTFLVEPYTGRVIDIETQQVIFEAPYPNWSQAYGGIRSWWQAQLEEDSE